MNTPEIHCAEKSLCWTRMVAEREGKQSRMAKTRDVEEEPEFSSMRKKIIKECLDNELGGLL
jgi:hypothetical protein